MLPPHEVPEMRVTSQSVVPRDITDEFTAAASSECSFTYLAFGGHWIFF